MFRKILFSVLFAAMALLSGCIQPINPADAPVAGEVHAEADSATNRTATMVSVYRLKAMDPIYIRFSGIQDQQYLEDVIDENGEIKLLHIDQPIKAAGLTTTQLEDKIKDLYIDGGIYISVSVVVTMTAKTYYVQGEVKAPGQFPLTSGTTLLQAIASARGYTEFADKKKVRILRSGTSTEKNMKDIEKNPALDVKIEAGDVVNVPPTWY
ncbi:MAG: SLBB domain-containing protein [Pontiellaceae bacterium]|nr:SLBB domain-containing protein [Pontiellaceae bacterium]